MDGSIKMLAETFVQLVDHTADDFDPIGLLTMLCGRCIDLLDVSEAAVALVDANGVLRVVAGSSDQASRLAQFQVDTEGPCLDAYRSCRSVFHNGLDGAWPCDTNTAHLRSVHAFPMRARDQAVGTLNLFRTQPRLLVGHRSHCRPDVRGRCRDRPPPGQGNQRSAPVNSATPRCFEEPHHHRTSKRHDRRTCRRHHGRGIRPTARLRPQSPNKIDRRCRSHRRTHPLPPTSGPPSAPVDAPASRRRGRHARTTTSTHITSRTWPPRPDNERRPQEPPTRRLVCRTGPRHGHRCLRRFR